MTYSAQVYKVLIASPSDVSEERELAVRIIQEWNDMNSSEREIVLLPLRWESHSAPEYGKRPQEIINRQVVDDCDFLIGIFWTRIGSPTGAADSGTLEEIERVSNDGKLAMLYFSKANKNPDDIDLEQLKQLRDFKAKTYPNALVENYSNHVEFKDKLTRQLDIQVKTMISMTSSDVEERKSSHGTDIELSFADIRSGENIGNAIDVKATSLEVVDFDEIPDYIPKGNVNTLLGGDFKSKDYYKITVSNLIKRNLFTPIRFWLTNKGIIGAKDVYLELRFKSNLSKIVLANESDMREGEYGHLWNNTQSIPMKKINDQHWVSSIEITALQPKRIVSPMLLFYVAAEKSGPISIEANIYADTLAEPIIQRLNIVYELGKATVNYSDLIARDD